MTDVAVASWQQAAIEVVTSIGTDVLAFASCSSAQPIGELALESQGAYVPILSGDHSLHVGVVSNEAGCHVLTRALLGMEPDEDVSSDDVRDAVGEIANMVAGGVKTKIVALGGEAQLGLPIFIRGHIEASSVSQCMISQLTFDNIEVKVTVVKTAKGVSRVMAAASVQHGAANDTASASA